MPEVRPSVPGWRERVVVVLVVQDRQVVAMKRQADPDCKACGICCVALVGSDIWAEVEAADYKRLGAVWCRRNVLEVGTLALLLNRINCREMVGGIIARWRKVKAGPLRGTEVCACVALKGSPMHRVRCAVYARRPRVCREAMNPGDRQCLALRRMTLDAAEREGGEHVLHGDALRMWLAVAASLAGGCAAAELASG